MDSGGEARFYEAVDLDDDVLARVQSQVRRRVLRWLARHGYMEDETVEGMLAWSHGGGFSLDASVRLASRDRQGLERCCGQAMRIVAFVTEGESVRRILSHVGEPTESPGLAPLRQQRSGAEPCFLCPIRGR